MSAKTMICLMLKVIIETSLNKKQKSFLIELRFANLVVDVSSRDAKRAICSIEVEPFQVFPNLSLSV